MSGLNFHLAIDFKTARSKILGGLDLTITGFFTEPSVAMVNSTVTIPVSQYTEHMFRNINGEKSFKEIFQGIEKDMGKKINDNDLMAEVNRVFPPFIKRGVLLLRNKKVKINPF